MRAICVRSIPYPATAWSMRKSSVGSRTRPLLSLQPYPLQEHICLVVKEVIFHLAAVCLEHGIAGDVDPVELLGNEALHFGAEALALLGIKRPPPLAHHGLEF